MFKSVDEFMCALLILSLKAFNSSEYSIIFSLDYIEILINTENISSNSQLKDILLCITFLLIIISTMNCKVFGTEHKLEFYAMQSLPRLLSKNPFATQLLFFLLHILFRKYFNI